jgi:hypothetical protein
MKSCHRVPPDAWAREAALDFDIVTNPETTERVFAGGPLASPQVSL